LRDSALSVARGMRLLPQPSQNLAAGRTSPPQLGHFRASGAAHSSQNRAPPRLAWLQAGQVIARGSRVNATDGSSSVWLIPLPQRAGAVGPGGWPSERSRTPPVTTRRRYARSGFGT